MFNNKNLQDKVNEQAKTIQSLEKEKTLLKTQVAELTKAIEEQEIKHKREKDDIEYANNRDKSVLMDTIKAKENAIEDTIFERTKKLKTRIDELEKNNSKLESENQILKKAFENMGFDVKDMKDILNKLVEGIVSKNTINVVK